MNTSHISVVGPTAIALFGGMLNFCSTIPILIIQKTKQLDGFQSDNALQSKC